MIPGLNHMSSIGSKPTCRKGVEISPVKEHYKVDPVLTERFSRQKLNESTLTSTNHTTSRNRASSLPKVQTEEKRQIRLKPKMARNNSVLMESLPPNPITNPVNEPYPYRKYQKDRSMRNSNSIYLPGQINLF
jgi:hypothetical protein